MQVSLSLSNFSENTLTDTARDASVMLLCHAVLIVNLTESKIPWASLWGIFFIMLIDVENPILIAGGTISWAWDCEFDSMERVSRMLAHINFSLLPDCGCSMTSCLTLPLPCLPRRDDLDGASNCEPNKLFLPFSRQTRPHVQLGTSNCLFVFVSDFCLMHMCLNVLGKHQTLVA